MIVYITYVCVNVHKYMHIHVQYVCIYKCTRILCVYIYIGIYTQKFNFNTRLEDRGSCYAHIPNCNIIPAKHAQTYTHACRLRLSLGLSRRSAVRFDILPFEFSRQASSFYLLHNRTWRKPLQYRQPRVFAYSSRLFQKHDGSPSIHSLDRLRDKFTR